MRLVILQDHLRNGGTERQSLAIAQGLAERGLEVYLLVFRKGGALDAQASNQSFKLVFLDQGPLKTDWFTPKLSRTLEKLNPDSVLAMGRMANCHAGLLAKRKRSFTLIATFRTGRKIPFLYRRAVKHADALVANSHEALQRIQNEYSIQRTNTDFVIYNGCLINPTLPSESGTPANDGAIHLCAISMFRPQKKQIRLVRICSQIPKDLPWTLTLAGEGPTRQSCEAEAKRLGIAKRVQFPGLLSDPLPLLQKAHIALHVSDQESLPNFLVEAQMSGLPVIAFNVNGVPETFLDKKSGYLVPHGDDERFLYYLNKLCRDPELRKRMSVEARQFAKQRFSQKAQIDAYFDLLHSSKVSDQFST